MAHTLRWRPVCPRLQRVQERARAYREEQFTSLAPLLDETALLRAYRRLKPDAAVGVDGESKASYGEGLAERLKSLHDRLRSGQYRTQPARRSTIKKADGSDRPLSIWSVSDKVVQGAVVEVLNSVYDQGFRGFSYGFRPGRSAHQALQAVQTVLQKGDVNWVLDLDLKQCFDRIEHAAVRQILKSRVNDRSLLKLIDKWLTVGVVEVSGQRTRQERGTPQGAPLSPVLANIVLDQAMDAVVERWRATQARGEVYIVRYADDAVLMFQYEDDAHALRTVLETSLARVGLELNEAKTRLVRFGRHRAVTGERPGTFDFLGFTHIAGRDRQGRYLVRRKTAAKRFRRSLSAAREWCRKHQHDPVRTQWHTLSLKLRGHYAYYGIRGNLAALQRFRTTLWWCWARSLCRRSQTSRLGSVVSYLQHHFPLPAPRLTHPDDWLPVQPGYLLRRAGCGKAARPDL